MEAYELHLKSRYCYRQRGAGLFQAIEYFWAAIEKDPGFPQPHAGLAETYTMLGMYGFIPTLEAHAKAGPAAERAVELDDGYAEGHYALALWKMYYGWDVVRAEGEFLRALDLDPHLAEACAHLSELTTALGRRDQGRELGWRAARMEPLSPVINMMAAFALAWSGSAEESLHCAQQATELEPGFLPGYWAQALAHQVAGRTEDAIAAYERATTGPHPSPLVRGFLASAYSWCGPDRRCRTPPFGTPRSGGRAVTRGIGLVGARRPRRGIRKLRSGVPQAKWYNLELWHISMGGKS